MEAIQVFKPQKLSWEQICQESEVVGTWPINLAFMKAIGRLPLKEELAAYIDLIIMPSDNLTIRNLQLRKLKELIKKNDRN